MKRSRGRGRKPQHNANRTFESNGPDVKIRGNATQIYDKYQQLARDAYASGDRVMAENYNQHAEHYYRIMAAVQAQQQAQQQQRNDGQRSDGQRNDGQRNDGGRGGNGNGQGANPQNGGQHGNGQGGRPQPAEAAAQAGEGSQPSFSLAEEDAPNPKDSAPA